MDERTARLRAMLPLGGRGLEIGPGYNPLLPKAEGFRVETADYTDADGLRAKYSGNPGVDLRRIEAVDHIVRGQQTLAEAVGRPGAFDYVYASHVVEHTPDLIAFLASCETLLAPGGLLLLAVPDKRHCFDALQPLTSTGRVLQAHLDGHVRPSPGTVFDDMAYNVARGGAIGWAAADERPLRFFAPFHAAMQAYDSARRSSDYVDVHVWRFVPSSFRLIVQDLFLLGEIGLREVAFHDSVGVEFYVSLAARGQGCAIGRDTLAQRALAEQAAVRLSLV